MDSPIMPWGKWKGLRVDEIESSYLIWVLERCENVKPALFAAVRDELGRRFGASPPSSVPASERCADPALARTIVAAGLKVLAKKHHPDKPGGNTELMQRITETTNWLNTLLRF